MKKAMNSKGAFLASLILAAQTAFYTSSAHAGVKVSGIFDNIGGEVKLILPWIFTIAAAGGAILVIGAIWSMISSKKNREPLTWQIWGVLGGGALALAGFILMSVIGSIGGDDAGKANSLGGLKLDYQK